MRAENFDIHTLIQHLEGTCKSLNEGVTDLYEGMEEDDLTDTDYAHIDNDIFCCSQCGWWCETGEAHDSGDGDICDDCHEGEEGEELMEEKVEQSMRASETYLDDFDEEEFRDEDEEDEEDEDY